MSVDCVDDNHFRDDYQELAKRFDRFKTLVIEKQKHKQNFIKFVLLGAFSSLP